MKIKKFSTFAFEDYLDTIKGTQPKNSRMNPLKDQVYDKAFETWKTERDWSDDNDDLQGEFDGRIIETGLAKSIKTAVDGKIHIYRGIDLKTGLQRGKPLGIYWTFDVDSAGPNGEGVWKQSDTNVLIVKAVASFDDVNWITTFVLNAYPENTEYEIRMTAGKSVIVDGFLWKGRDQKIKPISIKV